MAVIQVPVNVLDENCATCQNMDLDKTTLFAMNQIVNVEYTCRNLHMCTFIRNRIVRNMKKEEAAE